VSAGPAVVSIDDDTLAAVEAQWKLENNLLPKLFRQPPTAGWVRQLISKATGGQVLPVHMPYAQIESKFKNNQSAGTNGSWHDRRTVTIRVFGRKKECTDALAPIQSVFNSQTQLTYPSGAKCLQWWPDEAHNKLLPPTETARGQDVWILEVVATVWSIRIY
jgi:hypothetical protein